MNVYDFDGTIYKSNCAVGFALWCIWRHPKLIFTYLPKILWHFFLNKIGKIKTHMMLRTLFSYLTMIDDFDVQIEKFWDKNQSKIASWYLEQKKPDALIISA